jgi:hypothetical protein
VSTRNISVNLGGKFILVVGASSSKGIMLLSVDALFAFFFFCGPLHKYEKTRIIT